MSKAAKIAAEGRMRAALAKYFAEADRRRRQLACFYRNDAPMRTGAVT